MADYIDRVKLLDELGESASHHAESGREYQLLLRDRNIVREQPTADVIELSKIDKAIEEINHLTIYHKTTQGSELVSRKAVLRTINKYLGE